MIYLTEYINRERNERRLHIDLSEPCVERGGNSTNHKGVLAQFLNTEIPSGRILLCHACHNGKCSNPKHLYWGTDVDNMIDAKENGTWQSPWEATVQKYGYENACKMNSMPGNTHGKGNKGKAKTEEHKKNISLNRKGGKPKGWRKNKLVL